MAPSGAIAGWSGGPREDKAIKPAPVRFVENERGSPEESSEI